MFDIEQAAIFCYFSLSRSDKKRKVKGTQFPCGVWGKAPCRSPISPTTHNGASIGVERKKRKSVELESTAHVARL